ncbi:MAG: VWA domain-containing protein [Myxococcales bacterium]|nr:VWA domain-containing protein [Myxococcales bacterium]
MSRNPLTLQSHLAYPALGIEQQIQQTLMLSLSAEDIRVTQRPPITLMLCVDLSGSMMGRPLELVIESIRLLLQQLNEDDRLGMVTFANAGRLVTPVKLLTPETRGFFHGVLSGIQAAGSTNMEDGLRMAFKHVPEPREGELVHMVLLSDGKPNRGMTHPHDLESLVTRKRQNTTVSCFGYGLEHDEDLLQGITRQGGGGYAYVESGEVAPLAFARELGSLFSMVGTEIKILLRPGAGCSVLGIQGEQTIHYTDRGMAIAIPDMIGGQKIHIMLDMQIKTHARTAPLSVADIELNYTLPGQPPQQISFLHTVQAQVSPDAILRMNPIVAERLLLAEVAKATEEAHRFADKQQFDRAAQLLQPYIKKLEELDGFDQNDSEVRRWHDHVIDAIAVFTRRPDAEHYRRVRKAAKSDISDPTGMMRKTNTSMINLNTTQRELLSKLMQKVFGIPHAHVIVEQGPSNSNPKEGTIFPILGETIIGQNAQIQLDDVDISQKQARLVATPGGYLLIDMIATQPSLINNKPVKGPTLLKEGDLIQVGHFYLRFKMGIAPNLKDAQKLPPSF